MKKTSEDVIEKILDFYKIGKSLPFIASELKISKATVSKYINEAGISNYKDPIEITEDLLKNMQEDYNSGMSKRSIGRKYKIAFRRLGGLIKPEALTSYEVLKNRRYRVKEELIKYKGGQCEICGYNKCQNALEFHHLNPSEKDFSIASNSSYKNMEILKREVDKCILVCANCHREIHAGLIKI